MIKTVEIGGGYAKSGFPEPIRHLVLECGQIYAIIGQTGSGKTQLLEDIESLNNGEGHSKRKITINGEIPSPAFRHGYRSMVIAHLSQNMNYVLDMGVIDFLVMRENLRLQSAKDDLSGHVADTVESKEVAHHVLQTANSLTGEKIRPECLLTSLSGGQSRALMIADIALNAYAPVILIDEIENAGIDKQQALALLSKKDKIVLIVTHDPLLSLFGHKRILLVNGRIDKVIRRSPSELRIMESLSQIYNRVESLRHAIRRGESWEGEIKDVL